MSRPVLIFGADPSLANFGWCVLEIPQVGRPLMINGGVIHTSPKLPDSLLGETKNSEQERLRYIQREARRLLDGYNEDGCLIAASEISTGGWGVKKGPSMRQVFGSAERFDAACAELGLNNIRLQDNTWKKGIGLNWRKATKEAVEIEVKARVHTIPRWIEDMPKSRREHVFDAAGVALAASKTSGFMIWRKSK